MQPPRPRRPRGEGRRSVAVIGVLRLRLPVGPLASLAGHTVEDPSIRSLNGCRPSAGRTVTDPVQVGDGYGPTMPAARTLGAGSPPKSTQAEAMPSSRVTVGS